MKHSIFMIIFAVIVLVFLGGCGESSSNSRGDTTDWEPSLYETANSIEEVKMTAEDNTVTSISLNLLFENNTDKQFTYGDPFLLEKKKNENWYVVPVSLEVYGFNDIGYELDPQGQSEWKVDWEWLYGTLDSGDYRIIKDIIYVRDPGYDVDHLSAEFTID